MSKRNYPWEETEREKRIRLRHERNEEERRLNYQMLEERQIIRERAERAARYNRAREQLLREEEERRERENQRRRIEMARQERLRMFEQLRQQHQRELEQQRQRQQQQQLEQQQQQEQQPEFENEPPPLDIRYIPILVIYKNPMIIRRELAYHFIYGYSLIHVTNFRQPNESFVVAYSPSSEYTEGYVHSFHNPHLMLYSDDPEDGLRFPDPIIDKPSIEEYYDMIKECARLTYIEATQNIDVNLRTYYRGPAGQVYGSDINLYTVVVCFVDDQGEEHFKSISWPDIRRGLQHFILTMTELVIGAEDYRPDPVLINCTLDKSRVWIRYVDIGVIPVQDNDQSDFMIYHTVTHPLSPMKCIYRSLLDCDINVPALRDCVDIEVLKNYIIEEQLNISIIYNIPHLIPNIEASHRMGRKYKFHIKGRRHDKIFYELKDSHISTNYFYQAPIEDHILCYDVTRAHIEKIISPPRLLDKVYMAEYEIVRKLDDDNFNVIRHYNTIVRPKIPRRMEMDVAYIFFDFECVVDYDCENFSKSYSVSYMVADDEILEKLNNLEINFNEDEKNQFIRDHVYSIIGFNAVKLFLDRIYHIVNDPINNARYILIGFNNSLYDNFMLLTKLNAMKQPDESPLIDYVEYHGCNRIGNIIFFDKKCTVWDFKRFTPPGSLRELCKDFNVVNFAKRPDLISHLKVQQCYNTARRNDRNFFTDLFNIIPSDRIIEYNNYDVLSLAVIYHRYNTFLNEFNCVNIAFMKGIAPITDHSSLPAYLYKLSQTFIKDAGVKLPNLSYSQYQLIRESSVAGRIDVFGKKQKKYEEELVAFDVTSMYPYVMFVMNDCFFPMGEITDRLMTQNDIDDIINEITTTNNLEKIGYYKVDIDQTYLINNNKPIIRCHKMDLGNNWEEQPQVVLQTNIYLSSIDILQLLKHGCKVSFILNSRMLVFSEKVQNFKLFSWLTEFMVCKNLQDKYKEDNDPRYNPTVRVLAKNIMNSLSGKYMQRAYETVMVQIRKDEFYSHLSRTKDMVKDSQTILGVVSNTMVVMQYEKLQESITAIKPIYIGSLIYVYARKYMYDQLLNRLGTANCLYHDTDSVKFKKSVFDQHVDYYKNNIVPHNIEMEELDPRYIDHPLYKEGSKIFGGFANELKEGNNLTYVNDKKEWASFVINNNNEITWCVKSLKGIQSNALLLDMTHPDINGFVTEDNGQATVTDQGLALEFDIANGRELHFETPSNILKAFEDLHQDLDIYLMNTQFVRDISVSSVKVLYVLKKVTSGNRKRY